MKRLASSIQQHELINRELILSLRVAAEFSEATQFERVIDILTIFLVTIKFSMYDQDMTLPFYLRVL